MEFNDERYWLTISPCNRDPILDSTEIVSDGFLKPAEVLKLFEKYRKIGEWPTQFTLMRDDPEEEVTTKLKDDFTDRLYGFIKGKIAKDGFGRIYYDYDPFSSDNYDNSSHLELLLEDEYISLLRGVHDMDARDYTDLWDNLNEVELSSVNSHISEWQIPRDYALALSNITEKMLDHEYAIHRITKPEVIKKTLYDEYDELRGEIIEDKLDFEFGGRIVDIIADEMTKIARQRYESSEKEYEWRQSLLGDISRIDNPAGRPLIVSDAMAMNYQENVTELGKYTARAILIQEALEGASRKKELE